MLRAPRASPGLGQYPPEKVLEGKAGTEDTGLGCTRRVWALKTRTGRAHPVRGAAQEPPLGLPLELRLSQGQHPWTYLSPQERHCRNPLNLAP